QSVTADLGRLGARPALVDRRQRQQPSRLSGVHRALRQPAQLPRRVIPRSPTAAPMTNPHWFATVNHIPRALGIPSVSRSYGDWVLLDILELIERIERQTGGLTREQFLMELDVQDATAYRLLAIGEAAKELGDDC